MDAKKIHLIILGNGSKMSRMFVVAMTTVPNASFLLDVRQRRAIFKKKIRFQKLLSRISLAKKYSISNLIW
jgi:hypothetical protein